MSLDEAVQKMMLECYVVDAIESRIINALAVTGPVAMFVNNEVVKCFSVHARIAELHQK